MKRPRFLGAILIAMTALAGACNPRVAADVACLSGEDQSYITIRPCLRDLNFVLSSADIWQAVEPLTIILENPTQIHDPITRSLAADLLGKISSQVQAFISQEERRRIRELEEKFLRPYIDQAVHALLETYQNSAHDVMRASCVAGLAYAPGDNIQPFLEEVEANDLSVIVRMEACRSLTLRTNGTYSSATCNPPASAQAIAASAGLLEDQPLSPDELELARWLEAHILYTTYPLPLFTGQEQKP